MGNVSRRDFLKYIGAGGVGAGAGLLYGEAVKKPVEFLVPQVIPPEDWAPGVATWYNTSCGQCSAGCGISVRIREGRAKKIEGNAAHPINHGRLCSLGQSGLNALYNPDRLRHPLKLIGERGSGEYEEISWDEAMTTVSVRLGSMKIQKTGNRVHLLTGTTRGHLDVLLARFMRELGSQNYLQYDYTHPHTLYIANQICFGEALLPLYDIANTDYLVSFGADYLGTWLSPVQYSVAYGHMRQGRQDHQSGNARRGHTVQIEPRMSLSGAAADEWIPASSGSEAQFALAMAQYIVASQSYGGSDRDAWAGALADYTPDKVAAATGVDAARIKSLAQAFVDAEASLALGGGAASEGTNGVASLVAVNVLNYVAGNIGKPGGVLFNPVAAISRQSVARQADYSRMVEFVAAMNRGDIEVLLINGSNPVFNLPPAAAIADAMDNVEMIVAMSSFMDETTAMADIILPTDVYLESWGDDMPEPGVGIPTATISQPVTSRVFNTRSVGDIVLDLARQIGGELPAVMPWTTMEDYVRHSWQQIYSAAEPGEDGFGQFWESALRSGVWAINQPRAQAEVSVSPAVLQTAGSAQASFQGDGDFVLHPYLTGTFLDGRGANLPWQQELPDPLTSIVYNSWIELNPETAKEQGIREGDVLEVTSAAGSIRAPAFLYEGIRPDVVAVPVGQGHKHYGRYAQGRGANPLSIVAATTDAAGGTLASAATRVNIRKTGERVSLIKTDGVSRDLGRQILGPSHGHG